MTTVDNPEHPSEIRAAWLGEQLGRRVDRIEMEIIGQDRGFVGTIARLTIEGDGAGTSVIAKLASESETRWYREAGAVLSGVIPRYLGGSDTMLLLEDLSELEPGDVLVGTTSSRVRAVLSSMETVRAVWPTRPGWLAEWNGGDLAQRATRLSEALTRVDDFEEIPAGVKPVLERLPDLLPALVARLRQGRKGVIHRDLHLDNVFFDCDSPVLMDWQSVAWGPVAMDVAKQLAEMPSVADRRAMEGPYRAEFGDDLVLGLVWYVIGGVHWVVDGTRDGEHPRKLDLMADMLGSGKLLAALDDWDAVGVLSRLEGDLEVGSL